MKPVRGGPLTVTVWSLIFGWIKFDPVASIAEARTLAYEWERDQQSSVRMAGYHWRVAIIQSGDWSTSIRLNAYPTSKGRSA
jgi:hypothetical protein